MLGGDAVKQVRRAYNEKTRDLSMKTEPLDLETAKRAIQVIRQYNHFEAGRINRKLDTLARLDPNLTVAVGRENSPVLYLHTSEPAEAKSLFQGDADEIGVVGGEFSVGSAKTVRLWWD